MQDSFKMSNNPSKVIGIALCLIVVIYSGNKILNSNSFSMVPEIERSIIASPSLQGGVSNGSREATANEKPSAVSQHTTAAEVFDFKHWSEERGYISAEDMAVYQGYDLQTLESLAASGDVRAVDALAAIAVKSGDIEKAKAYYWRAGAMGSTAALGHIALLNEPSSFIEMSDFDRKEKIIETLAALRLAEIRGDVQVATVVAQGVKASYEASFGALIFSAEESARIQERAQQLYEELKLHRSELGLNDFDNSTPALLNNMYKTQ